MTAAHDIFLSGFHVAKTAGSTVAEHARIHLGEPEFYYYDRFTRTRRFWADIPQYEELADQEKGRIRLIFGHGVRFSLVNLQGRIPEFFTTIRHPIPFFHSRYTHQRISHAKQLTDLSFDAFLRKELPNRFSSLLVASFGELAEFGDEISYRNSVSILRNFKYVFATEHIDAQSPALWNSLGIPSAMERRRVAQQWEHVPISDDEILAMHEVDLQLYNEVATMRSVDLDRNGALNPYGYEPARYLANVAKNRKVPDRSAQIEDAYRELTSQLFLDFDLEAAIERMRYDTPHVREPELLRQIFLQKHKGSNNRYSEAQREASRRNAEAYRNGRCPAAAGTVMTRGGR
jgi:hypothetical protein